MTAPNQEIKNIFPHGSKRHRLTQVMCAEILVKRGFKLDDTRVFSKLVTVGKIPDLVPTRWLPRKGSETYWIEVEDTHKNLPELRTLKGFTSILVVPAIDMRKRLSDEYKRLEMELPE